VDQFRAAIRSRHYSRRTEESYWYWIRFFILSSGKRHPATMGASEVTAFLSWLATERNVAAATQNQALSALLFLYKHVLGQELPWLDAMTRAKRPVRLPVVLTETEIRRLLAALSGVKWLMASLLYGAGLRQRECLMLRVKDIDFAYRQILVRDGKGGKDRVTPLPEALIQPMQRHLGLVRELHRRDIAEGFGEVWLPDALSRKYPRAGAPKPSIESVDTFKRTLLNAKSIAYDPEGTTGKHVAKVLEQLGIAAEMKPKMKVHQGADRVVRAVATGEAELAFVSTATVAPGSGAEVAGFFPREVQDYVVYTAAVSATSKDPNAAKQLVDFLASDKATAVLKARGLERVAP
jgi:integrase